MTKRFFYVQDVLEETKNGTVQVSTQIHVPCTLCEEPTQFKNRQTTRIDEQTHTTAMSDVEDQIAEATEAVDDINLDDVPSPTAMSVAGSAVGSSVSQSNQNKIEVDASMFNNAMALLINLQNKVNIYTTITFYYWL